MGNSAVSNSCNNVTLSGEAIKGVLWENWGKYFHFLYDCSTIIAVVEDTSGPTNTSIDLLSLST